MGKKRVGGQGQQVTIAAAQAPVDTRRYWCYYCGNEARDEATLIQHQAAKHFQCPYCDPKAYGRLCQSLAGLISHVRRSHRKELTKVPGAIEGRDSPEVDVYGMTGIPTECLPPESETADVDAAIAAAAQAAALQEAATYQQPAIQKLPPIPQPLFETPAQSFQPPPQQKAPTPRANAQSSQNSGAKNEKMEGLTKALLAAASQPSPADAGGNSADPEGKTKALLAALATNTPEGIKAALRETTQPKKKQQQESTEQFEPEAAPAPTLSLPAGGWQPAEQPPQEPSGGVSVKTLVRLEKRLVENAMASARTLAAPKKPDPKLKDAFGFGGDDKDDKDKDHEDEAFPDPARRLYMGKIPRGTGEGLIRAECMKYGPVASILYNTSPEDPFEEPWCLVAFASADSVSVAVSRLKRRMGLFGAPQPVEVRQGTEYDINRMEELLKAAEAMRPAESEKQSLGPKSSDTLPAFLEQAQQMAAAGASAMSGGNIGGPPPQDRQRSRSHGRGGYKNDNRQDRYEEDDRYAHDGGRGGYDDDRGRNKQQQGRGGHDEGRQSKRDREPDRDERGRQPDRDERGREPMARRRGGRGDEDEQAQVDPYLLAEQGVDAEISGAIVKASKGGRGQQLAVREDSVSSSYSPEPVRAPKPRKVYGLGGFDNVAAEGQPPQAPKAPTALMLTDGGSGDGSLQLALVQDTKKIYDPFRVENTSDLVKPGMVPALSLFNTGEDFGAFSGGRHIGTRCGWAEFVTMDRRSYYVNVLTGAKTRHLPKEARRTR